VGEIIMQYGENIRTYKRVKSSMVISNDRDGDGAKIVAKSIMFFCVAILVSRVIMINKSAPFGIAFLLTILFLEDNKLSLFIRLYNYNRCTRELLNVYNYSSNFGYNMFNFK